MMELDWPEICLTPQRISQLQAEACVAHVNPFLALTTEAKLLAVGGSFQLARKVLNVVQEEFPVEKLDLGNAARLISGAMLAHAPSLAETWLKTMLATSYRIYIDPLFSELPGSVVRFQASTDEMTFQFSRELFQLPVIEMLLSRWVILCPLLHRFMLSPNQVCGAVNINLGDGGVVPGLSFCDHLPGSFLIPDPHYLAQDQYRGILASFDASPVVWADRAPVAFWRGSTTGAPADPAIGWRSLPRIRLCEIAAASPDLFDAGITGAVQRVDEAGWQELAAQNLTRSSVSRKAFQQYRYQIDIDGNSNSWDGFFTKLASGSPVLKVGSPYGFQQWYYDRLIPWVNFVPVESDMADLVDKVRWLRANDKAAERIGQAGHDLAAALTTEQELDSVPPVIAAAVRADACGPMTTLSFRANSPDTAALLAGWQAPGTMCVQSEHQECSLLLPLPPCRGDLVLMLEVAPVDSVPVALIALCGDEVIARWFIQQPTTVYALLSRGLVNPSGQVHLRLMLSDPKSGYGAFSLYRAGFARAGDWPAGRYPRLNQVLTALNEGRPIPAPSSGSGRRLYTWQGTLAYFHEEAGVVRHGPPETVPHNLFCLLQGHKALLLRTTSDGAQELVQLHPEGPHANTDRWLPWTAGMTFDLDVHEAPDSPVRRFGLKGAGLFLCAEPSGRLTLSRLKQSQWEVFQCD
ncbi:MAG: hypothetical protein JSS43_16940 [Proteobacteria bacterium]|nr:hypothetical protein [Pseudomonadota bacterium]